MGNFKENETKPIRFSLLMYIVAGLMVMKPLIRKVYNVGSKNSYVLKNIRPPYLMLGNHVTFFDPLLIGMFAGRRIFFVTSRTLLRKPLGRWFFSLIGVIPKNKASQDFSVIKNMESLIKRQQIVGLFPEGRQTWTGLSQTFYPSVAKLIKRFNIPVVFGQCRGGYFSKPRWSKIKRKYHIDINFKPMFTKENIEMMSEEEIFEKLKKEFVYNEYDYAKECGKIAKCKRGAEHIEAMLYCCPKCRSFSTLSSKGVVLTCSKCSMKAVWKGDYTFTFDNGDGEVRTIHNLAVDQRKYVTEFFNKNRDKYINEPFFSDDNVSLFSGTVDGLLKPILNGKMVAFSDRYEYYEEATGTGCKEIFYFNEIGNMHVTMVNMFEFKKGDMIFRTTYNGTDKSAFKYLNIMQTYFPKKAEMI